MKPGMCIAGTVVFRGIGNDWFPFLYVDRANRYPLVSTLRRLGDYDGRRVLAELVPGDTGGNWKVRRVLPL